MKFLINGWKCILGASLFKIPGIGLRCCRGQSIWYNTSYHLSSGMTPFKALYGRDPPTLTRYTTTSLVSSKLQDQLQARDQILTELKHNLARAQQSMKSQADKRRREVQFSVGDSVLVKLQPYRQSSVALRKHQML